MLSIDSRLCNLGLLWHRFCPSTENDAEKSEQWDCPQHSVFGAYPEGYALNTLLWVVFIHFFSH